MKNSLLLFATFAVMASCKKDEDPQPQPATTQQSPSGCSDLNGNYIPVGTK